MKFLELKEKIKTNIFSFNDVVKHFHNEKSTTTKNQLLRFTKKKLIHRLKKGWYCFDIALIDEFYLANILYQPSYISLESALNYYGLIPDIPQSVTSITPIKTKKIHSNLGNFYYTKIKKELFFGFDIIPQKEYFVKIAKKEKALLDYFYIRKIKKIDDLRLNLKTIDKKLYQRYLKIFPPWVKKIKI